MDYEFTQTWTKEDYVAFATNHMKASILKPTNLILFSLSIGYLIITPFFTGEFTFFFLGIGVFLFIGAFLLFTRAGAKKAYEKNKDFMTINFKITDDGITYMNVEGELVKPWNELYSFSETEEYFFVYFSKHRGMLFAKRDFSYELRRFIIDNVQKHLVNKRKIKLLKRDD